MYGEWCSFTLNLILFSIPNNTKRHINCYLPIIENPTNLKIFLNIMLANLICSMFLWYIQKLTLILLEKF